MGALRRGLNWSDDLVRWARDEIGKPYVWGETDCGSLLRRGLAIVYGQEIGEVPAYDSLSSAYRVSEAIGGLRAVLHRLGAEPIGLKFATTGDVILSDDWPAEDHPLDSGCLCLGPTILTGDPVVGVVVVDRPREGAFEAWRLPHELPDNG